MPLSVGDSLVERYELLALLGEGGSARVFRARDTNLDREVALKVMHVHNLTTDKERFLREVRVLARLTHPGVIPVLDIGAETSNECPFFTMPLLVGGPITVLGPLEDCRVSLERFINAAVFIARTLHHIHQHGMIHRDITPANLLLNDTLMPQVMDFGLVSLGEQTRHLTRSGVTLGTPAYMAPEQARGKRIDARSDLYALGAVLYRVACGSPPFVGENDQSILYQHVHENPLDPRELNPAIPDAVAQVLLDLLAKHPAHRPESGEALGHLLELARRELWSKHMRGQYRGGRTRNGEHPDGPAQVSHFKEVWSVPLPGEVTWPAAVVGHNDLVTVGTRGGQLVLIHTSGRPFATYAARDEVTAPANFIGEHILYGAWDGTLRRMDLQSGAQVWLHQARAEFTGTPTLWRNVVLAASRDSHLYALDIYTGQLTWAYKTNGPLAASPIIWAGATLICDESGWLHVLDGKSGVPLWKLEIGTVHATPALYPISQSEAVLVITTWEGEIHAIKLQVKNGRVAAANADDPILWSYDFEEELWASPAITSTVCTVPYSSQPANNHTNDDDDARPFGTWDIVVLAGWAGSVRALRLLDGEDIWLHNFQGRITASPVISAGLVFLASEAGEVAALDAATGATRWIVKEKHGVQATPLVAAGTLYVAFMDGTLRAYRDACESHDPKHAPK